MSGEPQLDPKKLPVTRNNDFLGKIKFELV
jgi:hypothetical protein